MIFSEKVPLSSIHIRTETVSYVVNNLPGLYYAIYYLYMHSFHHFAPDNDSHHNLDNR